MPSFEELQERLDKSERELAAALKERDEYIRLASLRFHENPAGERHEDIRRELAALRQQLAGAEEANGELKETKELIAKTVREVGYILEARAAQQSAPAPLKAQKSDSMNNDETSLHPSGANRTTPAWVYQAVTEIALHVEGRCSQVKIADIILNYAQ